MMTSFYLVAMFNYMFKKPSYYFFEVIIALMFVKFAQSIFSFQAGSMLMGFSWGMDTLSGILVCLTFLISVLMLSASYTGVVHQAKNYMIFAVLSFSMLGFLVMTFFSLKAINFYILFEASLIPIFLMIMGWGYQPERLQAGLYMLFYTLAASLPLLVVIILNSEYFEYFAFGVSSLKGSSMFNIFVSVMFIMAFCVKLPMFFFHLWLPKAHVEAPVAGSMLLAGVLLKLGSYGIWRVMCFTQNISMDMLMILSSIGMMGGVLASFVCFVQLDMKSLVAYSSVVHMGILLAGMSTLMTVGFYGALALMVGHGVVSSGMFYLVGVNYDRMMSRSLLFNKGMMIVLPSATVMWFFMSIFNISAPPSISLLGEICLTSSLLNYSSFMFVSLMLMNFMGMVFTFYLYAQSQQGKIDPRMMSFSSVIVREYLLGWVHIVMVFILLMSFWLFF